MSHFTSSLKKRSLSPISSASYDVPAAAEEATEAVETADDKNSMRKSRRISNLNTLYGCYLSLSLSAACAATSNESSSSLEGAQSNECPTPMTPIGYALSVDGNFSPRPDPLEDQLPLKAVLGLGPPSLLAAANAKQRTARQSTAAVNSTTAGITNESEASIAKISTNNNKAPTGAFDNFFRLNKALDVVDRVTSK